MSIEASPTPLEAAGHEPDPAALNNDQIIKDLRAENESLRRQLAEATSPLAGARTRDQFLAALSHELRDPLAPIRNSVALLNRAGSDDPILQQAREIIDRQVTHLSRLVDNLLDASRLAQGRITLCRERLDLGRILAEAAEEFRRPAEAAGVRLDLALPVTPLQVAGDGSRLAQMIGRLLENALQLCDRGGLVTATLDRDPQDRARLTVRDTGVGMDQATVDRVFVPFAQAAGSRTGAGMGLGLTLVKGLAELHGGQVTAHSDGPGKGSEFILTLPRVQAQPAARPGGAEAARPSRPRRILIVEDLSDAAITLELLLEMLGHTVEIAGNGMAAMDKARRFLPDVILCDIGLPGQLDGYDVARAIRADARLDAIHLIAVTGFNSQEDMEKAKRAGFDLHLTKPVDPVALERHLAHLSD